MLLEKLRLLLLKIDHEKIAIELLFFKVATLTISVPSYENINTVGGRWDGGAIVSSFSREGLVVPEYQVTLSCSDSAPQILY